MKSSALVDGHFAGGFVELDVKTEGLQGSGKVFGVVGEEGVGEAGLSVCEGSDKQGSVGQRLGAGHADSGIEGVINWDDFEGG
jgi:hypothetical protein